MTPAKQILSNSSKFSGLLHTCRAQQCTAEKLTCRAFKLDIIGFLDRPVLQTAVGCLLQALAYLNGVRCIMCDLVISLVTIWQP